MQPPASNGSPAPADDRRQHRRIKSPRNVSTPLGEVVDFSTGGLQIFRKGKAILQVDQEINLSLAHSGESLQLHARVAWIKPLGFRRRAIGLAFDELPDDAEQKLAQLVAQGHDEFAGPAAYFHA